MAQVFGDYFAWKQARLTPGFKRGIDKDKANCHSVSILTSLSKVFEKVIYDQTWNAFYNVLSSNLSGFMKTHSCCTALLKMTEDWRNSIDNKEAVAAVAVDLSKAFDTINNKFTLQVYIFRFTFIDCTGFVYVQTLCTNTLIIMHFICKL